jgi:hypothetical protein
MPHHGLLLTFRYANRRESEEVEKNVSLDPKLGIFSLLKHGIHLFVPCFDIGDDNRHVHVLAAVSTRLRKIGIEDRGRIWML